MSDPVALVSGLSGWALVLVVALLIGRELLRNHRADKEREAYVTSLEDRLDNLEALVAWQGARITDLQNALVAGGMQMPPERPRPALLVLTKSDHH